MSTLGQIGRTLGSTAYDTFLENAARGPWSAGRLVVSAAGELAGAMTAGAGSPGWGLAVIGATRVLFPFAQSVFKSSSGISPTNADAEALTRTNARICATVLLAGAGAALAYVTGFDPTWGAIAGTLPVAGCDTMDLRDNMLRGFPHSSRMSASAVTRS